MDEGQDACAGRVQCGTWAKRGSLLWLEGLVRTRTFEALNICEVCAFSVNSVFGPGRVRVRKITA